MGRLGHWKLVRKKTEDVRKKKSVVSLLVISYCTENHRDRTELRREIKTLPMLGTSCDPL